MGYRLLCAADWAALVVIYENLLMQPEKVAELPGVKEDRKLPRVLSREEVKRLLRSAADQEWCPRAGNKSGEAG